MKGFISAVAAMALAAVMGVPAQSADAAVSSRLAGNTRIDKMLQAPQPVREFRGHKPWANAGEELTEKIRRQGVAASALTPSAEFPGLSSFDYLEAPDGSTWFYTTNYDYKTVEFEGGYTEKQIIAYTFTIYDDSFNLLGTIHDDVVFGPNETRVASATLDPAVSYKFFNTDALPEVMVYLAMNTGAALNYKVNYYNRVYSLGGAKEGDNDVCIAVMNGRCVDAVNAATDSWSESFFYTFVEDIVPDINDYDNVVDYVNAYKNHICVYKKAGWSGGPEQILEYDINLVSVPGDTTDGIYFISKFENGVLYFVFSHYDKPYFVDPTGFAQDESATPDNALIIDVYSYTSSLRTVSTTSIPVEEFDNSKELHYAFYSIGSVAWKYDIDMSVNGTPEAPAFVVARDFVKAADIENVSTNYGIYNNAGEQVLSLAEDADGMMLLSNIEGTEPQVMFITLDSNDKYEFNFIDLYSGNCVLILDQQIEGEPITATGDRVFVGNGKYKYAFVLSNDRVNADGNQELGVAWINSDGTLDRIDRVNVGKNVARAMINMSGDVLSPYLYDTDPDMEYAVLVSRYTGSNSVVKNEFIVVDVKGDVLAEFSEADGKGAPYLFTVFFGNKQNRLHMVYNDNYTYNIDVYDLPFNMMAGGDGTAANPYQIASVGDLQMIKLNPAAHYAVVADIDATGFIFAPIGSFKGSLDGRGHQICNLTVGSNETYSGIFATTEPEAVIKNLTFIDPVIKVDGAIYAGLLAGTAMTATIENVKVYNLTIAGKAFGGNFGGLVGQATLNSLFSGCGVFATNLSLPAASSLGGIVGNARTGTSVSASAFTGSISGASAIGGIVGETVSGTENITDCHVDAVLSGRNTLGGIIGSSKRSTVKRCYVEGSITATEEPRWGYGFSVGGVVGALEPDFSGEGGVVVANNIVALKSISVPDIDLEEEYPGQKSSVHRIVGSSTANEIEISYDSKWEPVYGDAMSEYGLADNYALSSLAVIDSNVGAGATSTEGASLDEITRVFLDETLGWSFGTSANEPWHVYSESDPKLYFEASFIATPATLTVAEGDIFNITLRFMADEELTLADVLVDFLCEYDNTVVEMTGNAEMASNILTVEFSALKQGSTDVVLGTGGETATVAVAVVENEADGVENVALTAQPFGIGFDGTRLTAPDARIELFSANGIKVASGNGEVSVGQLLNGIYIAVARNAQGHTASLKIAVKH